MRATELLASQVYGGDGRPVGTVRDVRLARERDGTFRVVGLVVGEGFLAAAAHGWGFAEGRASGPWLLRKLFEPASRRARFIPADAVEEWGPGRIEIRKRDELRPVREANQG